MAREFFSIIRVYPSTYDLYDITSSSIEFEDMSGYQRWKSLRDSNTLHENLDVFVLTDIKSQIEVNELRLKIEQLMDEYHTKLHDLYQEYIKCNGVDDSLSWLDPIDRTDPIEAWNKYIESKLKVKNEVDSKFTNWLKSTYIKIEF